jgi:hypothetical protein
MMFYGGHGQELVDGASVEGRPTIILMIGVVNNLFGITEDEREEERGRLII